MRVHALHLRAPAFRAAIPSCIEDLRAACRSIGAEFLLTVIDSRAAFGEAWARIGDASPCVVVVVCGHGDRKQLAGRAEPTSWLLVGDTDPTEQSATTVDLDAAVHDLRARLDSPLVLVLDACHVDVRASLGNAAPTAVLLANPSGEVPRRVPTDHSCRGPSGGPSLSSGGGCASLDKVLARSCGEVERETVRCQRPDIRFFGDRRFLAQPVRPGRAGAAASALGARLAAMVHTDQLPQAALDALWQDVRDETPGEDHFELPLALAARALHPKPSRDGVAQRRRLLWRRGGCLTANSRRRPLLVGMGSKPPRRVTCARRSSSSRRSLIRSSRRVSATRSGPCTGVPSPSSWPSGTTPIRWSRRRPSGTLPASR